MKKTQSTGNHLDKNPEPFLADYLEGKETLQSNWLLGLKDNKGLLAELRVER